MPSLLSLEVAAPERNSDATARFLVRLVRPALFQPLCECPCPSFECSSGPCRAGLPTTQVLVSTYGRLGRAIDPTNLTRAFTTLLRKAGLRRIRFHDLRHSTATLLLEQGVELVVIKELLGHAHIGVTATVYAHVRLRLQRDAIDTLSTALDRPVNDESTRDDDGDPPLCGATVR
ncbi:tyrosine-type recombinase/integrase [Streptomyces sp. NPDC001937]